MMISGRNRWTGRSHIEQFQQKCAAVLRPELRENKEIGAALQKQKPGRSRAFVEMKDGLTSWQVPERRGQPALLPEPVQPGFRLPVVEP
jgi:hypothetical protein